MKLFSQPRAGALLLLAAAAGCAHAKPMSMTLNLVWTSGAPDLQGDIANAFVGQKLALVPLVDGRSAKTVGQNLEEAVPRPVYTSDNVAAFLTSSMATLLQQAAGINLVQTGPTRVLRGVVTQFFVQEGGLYEGTVAIQFTLQDARGRTLWQGIEVGHSKRFGHSFEAENYDETLSEASKGAILNLLTDSQFQMAMRGARPPPPAVVNTAAGSTTY